MLLSDRTARCLHCTVMSVCLSLSLLLSVCPSVRLSVCLSRCFVVNNTSYVHYTKSVNKWIGSASYQSYVHHFITFNPIHRRCRPCPLQHLLNRRRWCHLSNKFKICWDQANCHNLRVWNRRRQPAARLFQTTPYDINCIIQNRFRPERGRKRFWVIRTESLSDGAYDSTDLLSAGPSPRSLP